MIETLPPVDDEFYIGYEERMPARVARRVAAAVALFACGAAIGLAVTLAAQQVLPASRFEFGVIQPVTGVLRRAPYPSLQVEGRRVWLVAPGKFGADRMFAGILDGPVTIEGSAIQRGNNHMLEVTSFRVGSESVQSALGDHSERTLNGLRTDSERTLNGEVVDSKCFLGVMNPGEGAVHRDCARRCLSGGIPPMLLVRDGGGREELVLLVNASRGPIGTDIAALAGRGVQVTGRLAHDRDTWVLYADAAAYRAH